MEKGYFEERVKELSQRKGDGVNVYPKFVTTKSLKKYTETYKRLDKGQRLPHVLESLAGRVMSKQTFKNLTVYYLHGGGETILVKADTRNSVTVMRGDIIGVTGFPEKGKSGELILHPSLVEVLSPCVRNMPPLPKEVSEFSPGGPREPHKYSLKPEERARNRYLDLILHKDAREIFKTRTKIISYIRKFLDDLDFLEVETPVLSYIPGVGAGNPFVTMYKNMKLYLRVAPEVNLKKLVVGGFDRVYEIGKQFRNEGIDATHNPEFTSCELYMTYGDYEDMMKLTEKLLSGLVKEVTGSFVIKCHDLDKGPIDIDFTPPFRRVDFLEELEKVLGLSIPRDLGSKEANLSLKSACERLGVKCDSPFRTARLLDKLIDQLVVPSCINPTFLINYPKIMSVMAKSQESKAEITERFELYVLKQEELKAGEYDSTVIDEEFVRSLEYGLPPTVGWGMGIDRLVMLLTYSHNIKDVLLFPLMKPRAQVSRQES